MKQIDPSPQCEGVFQLFDADRSGQIDVREFMISLTNFAGTSKDDKLKFAFMIFDEDGNGVITKQEASKAVTFFSSHSEKSTCYCYLLYFCCHLVSWIEICMYVCTSGVNGAVRLVG